MAVRRCPALFVSASASCGRCHLPSNPAAAAGLFLPLSQDDHRYSEADRAAVYRAIAERRDMRHFRPGPVDPDTLQRKLEEMVFSDAWGNPA